MKTAIVENGIVTNIIVADRDYGKESMLAIFRLSSGMSSME